MSQQQIASGTGSVEFTTTVNSGGGPSMFVGLGSAPLLASPPAAAQLDYAFGMWPTGYSIFERGVWKYDGSFAAGDVFKIAIEPGPVVKYYQNGTLVFTSTTVPARYPYVLGTTLYYHGVSVNNAVIKTP